MWGPQSPLLQQWVVPELYRDCAVSNCPRSQAKIPEDWRKGPQAAIGTIPSSHL